MTGFFYKKHKIWFKTIAMVVVCLFLVNNSSYGIEAIQDKINNTVSAPSRFNYIYGDNFSIIDNSSETTPLEKALQNDASLVYISHLIGKILSGWGSIMSEKPIRSLIGKHLSKIGETNIKWQGLYKEGTTFCLPYVNSEGKQSILRYYLPEDKPEQIKTKKSVAIDSGKARVIIETESEPRETPQELISDDSQKQTEVIDPEETLIWLNIHGFLEEEKEELEKNVKEELKNKGFLGEELFLSPSVSDPHGIKDFTRILINKHAGKRRKIVLAGHSFVTLSDAGGCIEHAIRGICDALEEENFELFIPLELVGNASRRPVTKEDLLQVLEHTQLYFYRHTQIFFDNIMVAEWNLNIDFSQKPVIVQFFTSNKTMIKGLEGRRELRKKNEQKRKTSPLNEHVIEARHDIKLVPHKEALYSAEASRNLAKILEKTGIAAMPHSLILNFGCGVNLIEIPHKEVVNIDKNMEGEYLEKNHSFYRGDFLREDFFEKLRNDLIKDKNIQAMVFFNMGIYFLLYARENLKQASNFLSEEELMRLYFFNVVEKCLTEGVPLVLVEYMPPQITLASKTREKISLYKKVVRKIISEHIRRKKNNLKVEEHTIVDPSYGEAAVIYKVQDGISEKQKAKKTGGKGPKRGGFTLAELLVAITGLSFLFLSMPAIIEAMNSFFIKNEIIGILPILFVGGMIFSQILNFADNPESFKSSEPEEEIRNELDSLIKLIQEEEENRASFAVDELRSILGEIRKEEEFVELAIEYEGKLSALIKKRPELISARDAQIAANRILAELERRVLTIIGEEKARNRTVVNLLNERRLLDAGGKRRERFTITNEIWAKLPSKEQERFDTEKRRILQLFEKRLEERRLLASKGQLGALGRELSSKEALLYLTAFQLPRVKREAERALSNGDLNLFIEASKKISKPSQAKFLRDEDRESYYKIARSLMNDLDDRARRAFRLNNAVRELREAEKNPDTILTVMVEKDVYSSTGNLKGFVVNFQGVEGWINYRDCRPGTDPDRILGTNIKVVLESCQWEGIKPRPKFVSRGKRAIIPKNLILAKENKKKVTVKVTDVAYRAKDKAFVGFRVKYKGKTEGFIPLSRSDYEPWSLTEDINALVGKEIKVKVIETRPKLIFEYKTQKDAKVVYRSSDHKREESKHSPAKKGSISSKAVRKRRAAARKREKRLKEGTISYEDFLKNKKKGGKGPKKGGFASIELLVSLAGISTLATLPLAYVFFGIAAISIIVPYILFITKNESPVPGLPGNSIYLDNLKTALEFCKKRMESAAINANDAWYTNAEVALHLINKLKDIDLEYETTIRDFRDSFNRAERSYEPIHEFVAREEPSMDTLSRFDAIKDELDRLLAIAYARELTRSGFFGSALDIWNSFKVKGKIDRGFQQKAIRGKKVFQECLGVSGSVPKEEEITFHLRILADAVVTKNEEQKEKALQYFKERISKSERQAKIVYKELNKLLDFSAIESGEVFTNCAIMHVLPLFPDEYIDIRLARRVVQFIKYRGGHRDLVVASGKHFFNSLPDRLIYEPLPKRKEDIGEEEMRDILSDPVKQYLREIGQHPMLTEVGELKIASFIVLGDASLRESFIKSNLRASVWVAKNYKWLGGVSFMELINAGNEGLIKAIDRYDPTRGVKLISYATWWIRNFILAYIDQNRSVIKVPWARVAEYKKKCRKAGIDPEDTSIPPREVAEKIEATVYSVVEIRRIMSFAFLSLNDEAPDKGSSRPLRVSDDIEVHDKVLESRITDAEMTALSSIIKAEQKQSEKWASDLAKNQRAANLNVVIANAHVDITTITRQMTSAAALGNKIWADHAEMVIKKLRKIYAIDPRFEEVFFSFIDAFDEARDLYKPSKDPTYVQFNRKVELDKEALGKELGQHIKHVRRVKKLEEELKNIKAAYRNRNKGKEGSLSPIVMAASFVIGTIIIAEVLTGGIIIPAILASMTSFLARSGRIGIAPLLLVAAAIITQSTFLAAGRSYHHPQENGTEDISLQNAIRDISHNRDFHLRAVLVTKLYKKLSPEAKKILLHPEVFSVFLGAKPGYIQYTDNNDPDIKLLAKEVMENRAIAKQLGLIFNGPYIFSEEHFFNRLKDEGYFLIDNGILTAEDLNVLLNGKGGEKSEKLNDLLVKFLNSDEGRSIFHGFLIGYPLEDILYVKELRKHNNDIVPESANVEISEYGISILSEGSQKTKTTLGVWDYVIYFGYKLLATQDDFVESISEEALSIFESLGGKVLNRKKIDEKEKASKAKKDLETYLGGKKLINSVFEGGGAKGVAYVGALDELAKKNMWFEKVAGTSAGAITASLIAVGYTHKEIRKIIFETDFNQFKDKRWGFLPSWLNLLLFGGLYRGKSFERWLAQKLKDKLGYEPTIKDLPIPLTVIASDISDNQMLILDAETAPDLKVAEAVRMSMGIPFFFNVFRWLGKYKDKIKIRRVVDGGLLSNFPLFVFDKEGKEGKPVIGFMLQEIAQKKKPKGFLSRILKMLTYIPVVHIIASLATTGIDAHDKRHIEDDVWARIVNIPVDVGTTDFNISLKKKKELAERGRKATEKLLDKAMKGEKGKHSAEEKPEEPLINSNETSIDYPLSNPDELQNIDAERLEKLADYLEGKELIDSVFEGGGAKGVAYIGALEELAKKNMWFRKVAGTSAGAITASLIAVGYTHKEIRKIIFETDFNQFKDKRWGFLPSWLNLLLFGGLYRGKSFERWLSGKLKDKLGFEPTIKDLPIPLTVIASDITNADMLILDAETAPDLKVSEAVRMSMGIPIFFNVFKWLGRYKSKIKIRRVVDGGLLSNFPIFVFDKDGERGVPVVGFMVHEIAQKKKAKGFLPWILKLLKTIPFVNILTALVTTGLDAHDKRHIEDDVWARIVNIPVDVSTTDFDISLKKKEELVERGRKATKKSLDKALKGKKGLKIPDEFGPEKSYKNQPFKKTTEKAPLEITYDIHGTSVDLRLHEQEKIRKAIEENRSTFFMAPHGSFKSTSYVLTRAKMEHEGEVKRMSILYAPFIEKFFEDIEAEEKRLGGKLDVIVIDSLRHYYSDELRKEFIGVVSKLLDDGYNLHFIDTLNGGPVILEELKKLYGEKGLELELIYSSMLSENATRGVAAALKTGESPRDEVIDRFIEISDGWAGVSYKYKIAESNERIFEKVFPVLNEETYRDDSIDEMVLKLYARWICMPVGPNSYFTWNSTHEKDGSLAASMLRRFLKGENFEIKLTEKELESYKNRTSTILDILKKRYLRSDISIVKAYKRNILLYDHEKGKVVFPRGLVLSFTLMFLAPYYEMDEKDALTKEEIEGVIKKILPDVRTVDWEVLAKEMRMSKKDDPSVDPDKELKWFISELGEEERTLFNFGKAKMFDPTNKEDRKVWEKRQDAFSKALNQLKRSLPVKKVGGILEDILENAYDAIVSLYDPAVSFEEPLSGYEGNITIEFELQEDDLVIIVSDNGKGMQEVITSRKEGIPALEFYLGGIGSGLRNIRRQVSSLGGDFKLEEANAEGISTQAVLRIPLASLQLKDKEDTPKMLEEFSMQPSLTEATDMAEVLNSSDQDTPKEEREFIITTNSSFNLKGATIEQKEYDVRSLPSTIFSVVQVTLNGKPYKVGKGHYLVITLANGKKVYWGGQHNLSYSFFFEHYRDKAQSVVSKRRLIWRHLDEHTDLGRYRDVKQTQHKVVKGWKEEVKFGIEKLSMSDYMGYILTTDILSEFYSANSPRELGELAAEHKAKNITGGVTDIDIDIVMADEEPITDYEAKRRFKKMKEHFVSFAATSDLCFITNSSELNVVSHAPLHINPYLATELNGELIQDLATQASKEYETLEKLIIETRKEWKGYGDCVKHSKDLVRRLTKLGVKAFVVKHEGILHYYVETDDFIIDPYPEGMSDRSEELAEKRGDRRFIIARKDSQEASELYYGTKEEELTQEAIEDAKDDKLYFVQRRLYFSDLLKRRRTELLEEEALVRDNDPQIVDLLKQIKNEDERIKSVSDVKKADENYIGHPRDGVESTLQMFLEKGYSSTDKKAQAKAFVERTYGEIIDAPELYGASFREELARRIQENIQDKLPGIVEEFKKLKHSVKLINIELPQERSSFFEKYGYQKKLVLRTLLYTLSEALDKYRVVRLPLIMHADNDYLLGFNSMNSSWLYNIFGEPTIGISYDLETYLKYLDGKNRKAGFKTNLYLEALTHEALHTIFSHEEARIVAKYLFPENYPDETEIAEKGGLLNMAITSFKSSEIVSHYLLRPRQFSVFHDQEETIAIISDAMNRTDLTYEPFREKFFGSIIEFLNADFVAYGFLSEGEWPLEYELNKAFVILNAIYNFLKKNPSAVLPQEILDAVNGILKSKSSYVKENLQYAAKRVIDICEEENQQIKDPPQPQKGFGPGSPHIDQPADTMLLEQDKVYAEAEEETESRAKEILEKIGFIDRPGEALRYIVYELKLKEISTQLTFSDYSALFDYFWMRNGNNLEFPEELKLKLIPLWWSLPRANMANILSGQPDGSIIAHLLDIGVITTNEEEQFLWKLFHMRAPEWSNRRFDDLKKEAPEIVLAIEDEIEQASRVLRVLELGCGPTGQALQGLKSKYKDKIDAFGVDLEIYNENMEGITLKEANIRNLSFEDESFDLIYEYMALDALKDEHLEKSISEAMRVLAPGGRLIIRKPLKAKLVHSILDNLGIDYEITGISSFIITKKDVSETNDYMEKAKNLLASTGITQGSSVLSIGAGLRGLPDFYEDAPIIPWEELLVSRGADVYIYEPDPYHNPLWKKLVVEWRMQYEGSLNVLPAEEAYFDKANIKPGTIKAAFIMSVLSSNGISYSTKINILLNAIKSLTPDGCLVIGWYNTARHEAGEYKRTQEIIQKVQELGYKFEEFARGSEPRAMHGKHSVRALSQNWICYKVISNKSIVDETLNLKNPATRTQGNEKKVDLEAMAEKRAQEFIDTLVYSAIEADANGKNIVLGVDTSIIPTIQINTSAMNNLLGALRKMNLKNVIICEGEGTRLMREIEKARSVYNTPKSHVVVVGEKEVLSSSVFNPLRAENKGEIGAFFAEVVVPEGFPDDGDTELISIVTQAIREASKYDKISRRKEFFLKAEPVGIDKLVEKLEIQTERISA